MRSLLSSALVVSFLASTAHAQPGADQQPDPTPYPPPPPVTQDPSPYPQPPQPPQQQPYVPQPYQYVPQIQISPEDQQLLMRGEISDGQHVGGVVANLFFGFGIGQAIQGRWGETGWIFTLGELASITALFVGVARSVDCGFEENCDADEDSGVGLMVAGLVGYGVFHVWSIVDAVTGPTKHNRRVRDLRFRLGVPVPIYGKAIPYVLPAKDGGGAVAGLTFRF